jgi:lipopolysaccharide biosynthesis glycosyltransferase
MSELHVSCAAVGEYIKHSAVTLHSVIQHAGHSSVRVHYLCGTDFSDHDASQLASMVESLGSEIDFHRVPDERLEGLPIISQFTSAMWYRIFLPELLPEVDRVLYLDSDTIAVDSLEPLLQVPLSGSWVAAVTNVFQENHVWRPFELGMDDPTVYFNSGVLLMNLEQMRVDNRTAALAACAREWGPRLEWPDQDALNLTLGHRRVALHPRWNCMNSVLTLKAARTAHGRWRVWQARRRPAIRHFEGPHKPWHDDADPADRELYARHRSQTPWPDFDLGPQARVSA